MKTLNELIDERTKSFLENQEKMRNEYGDQYNYAIESFDSYKEILTRKVLYKIPPRYIDSDISDNVLIEKIKNAINEKKGIYLYGTAGTGKTYILYAILKRIRLNDIKNTIWNLPQKLAELKSFYSNKESGGEEEITREIETDVALFIDDFGAEKVTEWNSEIMYRLINYRYENMLRTFFASNLSIQELAERSGDRIASRIVEMCDVIEIKGEDKRLQKYGDNKQNSVSP